MYYIGLFPPSFLNYISIYVSVSFFQENKRNVKRKCDKMSKIQDLPDELVLKILRKSETKDLISCGQVSQRLRKISHDGSLWTTASLEKKIVKTDLLEMILSKGCKILNISNSTFVGTLSSNIKSQLRVLDLSQELGVTKEPTVGSLGVTENIKFFEELLLLCRSLQHLEMKGLPITPKMAVGICKNGKTLQKLNLNYTFVDELSYSDNQPYDSFQEIVKWCQELKEVDMNYIDEIEGFNYMDGDEGRTHDDIGVYYDLQYLVTNISPNVEKLNLSSNCIVDEQVEILLNRCKKLKRLSLKAKSITNVSLRNIRQYLNLTLEELSLGPCDIRFTSCLKLKSMPRLKILNLYCKKENDQVIQNLRLHLPHLKINGVLN